MDSESFRGVRPAAPARADDERVAVSHRSGGDRPTSSHHRSRKPRDKKKTIILAVAAAVLVVGIVFGGWTLYRSMTSGGIDSGKYQAVFFTNGQVYFGKLQNKGDYMRLTSVYYLQAKAAAADSKNPQETADSTGSDVQLIKLGGEIHGPEDEMIISKDQVLFFENLKAEGTVAKTIAQDQAKK